MNCNRNDRGGAAQTVLAGALLLALTACGERAAEPVMSAPPPPPPMSAPPPPSPPAPPTIYRVASGSPSVLARFPRGTQVTLQTEICLMAGEQITVTGSNGQNVTYNRPGCLKRSGNPTPQNAGGFTFGWARPSGREAIEAAK